ncbi:uncharacterized protein LOC110445736 [Mizuhopecten yessoensis]|uniref:uncharacterized protein LOC110445736 n=1 Tax=Mizuhopecten yessoensis TaxID=6573 RepID=UPI000B45A0C9|nr:uncharacterized protein LOC110445736 [Mizuhopecten yessoensis]
MSTRDSVLPSRRSATAPPPSPSETAPPPSQTAPPPRATAICTPSGPSLTIDDELHMDLPKLRRSQPRPSKASKEQQKKDIARFVRNEVKESQGSLFTQMEHLPSAKLNQFQDQGKENQRQQSESQIARIESISDSAYTFTKKGNEEQHKVNV